MRERGMIFNADMVRAVLNGSKTQTRRIMKVQPEKIPPDAEHGEPGYWIPWDEVESMVRNEDMRHACPFGEVGKRLWVRETWGVVSHAFDDDGLMIDYVPDRPAKAVHEMRYGKGYYSGHVIYAADGGFTWGDDDGCVDGRSCWKPSIHMPRCASRITLEITGVRVERLNSISEQDALAEGIRRRDSTPVTDPAYCNYLAANLNDVQEWFDRPSDSFISLWQSIYGAESWQHSPWVWVIEFKRVEGGSHD